VGFEVLTTVTIKSTVFWDVMPCCLVEFQQRFGKTYCLRLQGRTGFAAYCFLVAWLTLRDWKWRHYEYVPTKRRWISIGLHDVTFQKTVGYYWSTGCPKILEPMGIVIVFYFYLQVKVKR
jgi:hypothetical protein